MYERHGEALPNGFHVGDLVSYDSGAEVRYGVLVPTPARWARPRVMTSGPASDGAKWSARWTATVDAALTGYARYNPEDQVESYTTREATLITSHDGTAPTSTEGSTEMSITFNGEEIDTTQRVAEVLAGVEYRVIYPQPHHNFEFIGRARYTETRGRSASFEITRWVRENPDGGYDISNYPIGYVFGSTSDRYDGTDPTCLWLPVTPEATVTQEVQEEAYDGQKGAFLPHGGEMPEPGTIVRGLVHTTNKQVEGLFLRLGTEGTTADIEVKRRRTKRANGTFGAWETYANTTRRAVTIDGAEVFKPGASKPAEVVLTRGAVIRSAADSAAVNIGDILSAKEHYGSDTRAYRGEVVRKVNEHGEWIINATEEARLSSHSQATGAYDWRPIEPREVHVVAVWSDGDRGYDRAGHVWTKLAPGAKPVDPAFDPNRKTPYTGQKIGDVVVGLLKDQDGRRDTVSSWVRGEIVKWNVRYGRPIVKVTDKMESTKKVDAEVELVPEDTYPAMADPSAVSPEEYKKTLRLYLIGRHKRGDFCRGGLNTMLAAHGIPLYETRRRAQMVVTVDYDPNETDLYAVQQDLRSKMAGVSGLSFAERSGEDIELNVESDVTQG